MAGERIKALLVNVGPSSKRQPFRSQPLGLMYLAAYAERELPGAEVDILDLRVSRTRPEDLGRIALEKGAQVVGLSAPSIYAGMLKESATAVRRSAPGVLIVAGGPHPSADPRDTLASGDIDIAVCGEGEQAFVDILRARLAGAALTGIPSTMTSGMDAPLPPGTLPDPDSLPFPAWDKVDVAGYARYTGFTFLGQRRYMGLFTSRACPYGCTYCHNIFGRKFRARSAASVLAEIRTVHERYGIADFEVLDDIFNLRRERVVEICQGLLQDGPKVQISFPNGLRSDLLDDELLELMRAAGTTYISFAIETASPRLQREIKKNLKVAKAENAIRKAASLGILTNGYFMLGFPTETEEEMRSTISLAIRLPLDMAHFHKVTPFVGTDLADSLGAAMPQSFNESPEVRSYEDRSFNLSAVPNDRFRRILVGAFVKFYVNPGRLLGIFRHHPSPIRLLRLVGFAFRYVFVTRAVRPVHLDRPAAMSRLRPRLWFTQAWRYAGRVRILRPGQSVSGST